MDLLERIKQAGVIGCGGAGFPTHVKFSAKADYLILNAAECEPLLRTDRYLMCHSAERIVHALSEVRRFLGGIPCYIALKESYKQEISALTAAINKLDDGIQLHLMPGFYPAGDEQVIVAQVTGRVVPAGGIPPDVGCIVSNVATMLCVEDALSGIPFTEKYLTVNGIVACPTVMKVPVGTSFEECIALAGGALSEDYMVVSGGPMMGARMTKEEAMQSYVSKTTSGILVLPQDSAIANSLKLTTKHMMNRARSACIQCNYCTQLCPRYLLGHPLQPHRIMRKTSLSDGFTEEFLQDEDIRRAALCCECGVCELYACPMMLQPRRINAMLKKELAKAGIRYEKGSGQKEPHAQRSERFVPTKRAAARAGVYKYYDACSAETLKEHTPKAVSLSLKMHIGAPSVPAVQQSEQVQKGQLIARCPDDALGANLHASISGRISFDEGAINIIGEEAN